MNPLIKIAKKERDLDEIVRLFSSGDNKTDLPNVIKKLLVDETINLMPKDFDLPLLMQDLSRRPLIVETLLSRTNFFETLS